MSCISDDGERSPELRWGFYERQDDGDLVFVELPKIPLQLAGLTSPCEVRLFDGPRQIVIEPEQL